MLSTDASILTQGSNAYERMLGYAKLFEELHIIVYVRSLKSEVRRVGNLYLYPTNTRFRLAYFWQAYKIGYSIIRNWKLEIRNCVITTQDPFETGLVGVWLKNKFMIPLQIQCHVDFLNKYFWQESLKNKLRTILAKFILSRADGIRVVSERIKSSFISYFLHPKSDIVVLPIFVDIKKIVDAPIKTDLHKKYQNFDFIILMASRLSCEKNIGLAIEAMKEVALKYPRALLLIVGSGDDKARFQLRENIIFEPWTEDLSSYYKTADLFVLASNYEGYGRTIIEALAAKLPVVSTDVGIASEFVSRSGGLVVGVGDQAALSRAMLEMINHKHAGNLGAIYEVIKDMLSREEYLRLYKESLEKLISK